MIKSWDYLNYYKKNKKEIIKLVDKVFSSGNLILGPEVEKLEKNFSKFIGSKFAVGVGNCTDAIYISLKALNIGRGCEVITVSNTAVPTISAIVNTGAVPRYVDIGDDYLIDTEKIEKLINKKTKAIIPVHLYGQVCDMKKIIKIAKKYNLKIIEDCAQSTGASQNGKKSGNFGDTGCFSFYPTKIMGGFGDGGMITTNNLKIYKKILKLRFMGIDRKSNYFATINGVNSRLDEVHASILNLKLKKINKEIKTRNKISKIYFKGFQNTDLILPKINKNNKHVFYEYVVRSNKRSEIIKKLKKNKIFLKITYPHPIHKMPPYRVYSRESSLANTTKYSKLIFSLPIYPELTKTDQKKIIINIKEIL